MTAGAIDPEQLAAVVNGPLQFKAGLDVRILLGAPQHPEHQDDARRGSRYNKGGDQAATSIVCISWSRFDRNS